MLVTTWLSVERGTGGLGRHRVVFDHHHVRLFREEFGALVQHADAGIEITSQSLKAFGSTIGVHEMKVTTASATLLSLLSVSVLRTAALPLRLNSLVPTWSWTTRMRDSHGDIFARTDADFDNVSYADVVKIGAHDSMAIGTRIVHNQHLTVTQQLDLGIRLLQAQGHPWDNPSSANPSGISLCHTSCYLQNGGYLEDWLGEILAWMDRHPAEIVTLLLTNPQNADIDDWAQGFESLAVYQRAFTPRLPDISRKAWPTYAEMRATNQTLVIFMDRGTSFSKYPYIINEFANVWENAYDQTELPFNCSVERGKNPTDRLGLINHFLNDELVATGIMYPDKDQLNQVNAASGSFGLISNFHNCTAQHGGTRPTFMLINFSDVPSSGGALAAAAMLNNLTDAGVLPVTSSAAITADRGPTRVLVCSLVGITVAALLL
ncbi:uncharacterized protein UMAG_10416 [Mycosarcoma maydis]|uniref:Phosphatidylinositol-specific phospholipase C X domain-containing protein n=1 Tax=Mycosarcoma maydis TaxID=5270 RepID=A0A0D1DYX5_MYCMD|nr:uncharacterized protein UMAG_10416 [Ustilago maydis 521]KIS67755.1 hypothetical protein UMAG_10416 [Ustilago maydis 521]|eukprot:XP_011390768.1 hypothetical protein UMAG_10416 [Ustilago maydis 521]